MGKISTHILLSKETIGVLIIFMVSVAILHPQKLENTTPVFSMF
jgi:hypothetical protein